MQMMALSGSGGAGAAGLAAAGMFGANPMMQFLAVNQGSGLLELGLKVTTALSSTYGWDGINRFECQMYGGCWVESAGCLKAFDMADWPDDAKFVQAVSVALYYSQSSESATGAGSTTATTGGSNTNQGGGDISSLFRSGGMFFGQPQAGAAMNPFGQMPQAGQMNQFGMGGFMQQPPNSLGLNLGGTTNMLGGMQNMDMSNPTALLAMQAMQGTGNSNGLGGLPDIDDIVENKLAMARMQWYQQQADVNNPSTCSAMPQDTRQQCGAYSGGLFQDMQMCQAKGCCFDATMWYYYDKEQKEEQQSSSTRSSPFRSATSSQTSQSSSSTSSSSTRQNLFRGRRDTTDFKPARAKRSTQRSSVLLPNPLTGMAQPVCTWNNPHDGLLNLKSLQDVIKPCCKKVFCYTAAPDAAWTAWKPWSACSATCLDGQGGGMQRRFRNCEKNGVVVEPSRCGGEAEQVQQCAQNQCPGLSQWSRWTSCSTTCGQGVQTRRRQCSQQGMCNAPLYESRACSVEGCMSQWSQWSLCSKECGNGRQERSRVCLDAGGCSGRALEQRQCNTQYCESWGSWEPVGSCQNERMCGAGTQLMERECIGGVVGAPGCTGPTTSQNPCMMPGCAQWSSWGGYTVCQNNEKTRTRQCNFGAPGQSGCPGASSETVRCWGNWGGSNSYGGWAQWGNWGGCYGSRQTRSRTCRVMGACQGSSTDSRTCTGSGSAGGGNWNWNQFQQNTFGWGKK